MGSSVTSGVQVGETKLPLPLRYSAGEQRARARHALGTEKEGGATRQGALRHQMLRGDQPSLICCCLTPSGNKETLG